MTSASTIVRYADELHGALVAGLTVAPIRAREPELTLDDAYRIQEELVARCVEDGRPPVGWKVGVTGQALQARLGVDEPVFGRLLSGTARQEGTPVDLDAFIQPRGEIEVAFVLARGLSGPGVTVAEVLEATDYVAPAVEIVDTRIAEWKVAIHDMVADDGLAGGFVLGDEHGDPRDIEGALRGLVMERNGERVEGGPSELSPVEAVAWLANAAGRRGLSLEPGDVILTGSLSPLLPLEDGDRLYGRMVPLGSLTVGFQGRPAAGTAR